MNLYSTFKVMVYFNDGTYKETMEYDEYLDAVHYFQNVQKCGYKCTLIEVNHNEEILIEHDPRK